MPEQVFTILTGTELLNWWE